MTIPKRVDVFVSYRHLDPTRTWVRETLVPKIDAAGFSVLLDSRDFRAGDANRYRYVRDIPAGPEGGPNPLPADTAPETR